MLALNHKHSGLILNTVCQQTLFKHSLSADTDSSLMQTITILVCGQTPRLTVIQVPTLCRAVN